MSSIFKHKYSFLLDKLLPIFSLFFFICVIIILKQELSHYKFSDIIKSLSTIPKYKVYLAIILTFLGYLVITIYEKIALIYLKYPLKNSYIVKTAFISYAICNTTSFTLLVGGGIRYYFYGYYSVPKKIITQIIAFSNLNFWLGLFAVGGATFICEPLAVPELIHLRFLTVRPIGIIFLIILSVYLYVSWQQISFKIKDKTFIIPNLFTSLTQILISTLDWAIAGFVLYILLPNHTNLSYLSFFGIYLLGISAAIISHIPGGLGVFETIILYLLPKQIAASDVLSSLLAYRGIYFFLPLLIALIWLIIDKIQRKNNF